MDNLLPVLLVLGGIGITTSDMIKDCHCQNDETPVCATVTGGDVIEVFNTCYFNCENKYRLNHGLPVLRLASGKCDGEARSSTAKHKDNKQAQESEVENRGAFDAKPADPGSDLMPGVAKPNEHGVTWKFPSKEVFQHCTQVELDKETDTSKGVGWLYPIHQLRDSTSHVHVPFRVLENPSNGNQAKQETKDISNRDGEETLTNDKQLNSNKEGAVHGELDNKADDPDDCKCNKTSDPVCGSDGRSEIEFINACFATCTNTDRLERGLPAYIINHNKCKRRPDMKDLDLDVQLNSRDGDEDDADSTCTHCPNSKIKQFCITSDLTGTVIIQNPCQINCLVRQLKKLGLPAPKGVPTRTCNKTADTAGGKFFIPRSEDSQEKPGRWGVGNSKETRDLVNREIEETFDARPNKESLTNRAESWFGDMEEPDNYEDNFYHEFGIDYLPALPDIGDEES